MCVSHFSPVQSILDILNKTVTNLDGSQSPQITDLSSLLSDNIQSSRDIDSDQPSPITLLPTIGFVNGKYEVSFVP